MQFREAVESTDSSSWAGVCGGEQHQDAQGVGRVQSCLCVTHITRVGAGGAGSAMRFAIKLGTVWQTGLYLPLS